MTFRPHRTHAAAALALLALTGGALAPAQVLAAAGGGPSSGGTGTTGGAAPAGSTGTTGSTNGPRRSPGAGRESTGSTGSQPASQPGNAQLTASGNGITIVTHAAGMLGGKVTVTGSVSGVPAGTRVEIQRSGRQTHDQWLDTTHGFTDSAGNFTAVWPANHIGEFAIRAVPSASGNARAAASGQSTPPTSPSVTVTVYRGAIATYYGPGSWGNQTACGQTLQRNTLGVANRTLPCGTPVAIYYQGRRIVVPVIDRGPYANGADWDLTEATARAIGMDGTAHIGAVSLPRPAAS